MPHGVDAAGHQAGEVDRELAFAVAAAIAARALSLEPLPQGHVEGPALGVGPQGVGIEGVVGQRLGGGVERLIQVALGLGRPEHLSRAGLPLDEDVLLGEVVVDVKHEGDVQLDRRIVGLDLGGGGLDLPGGAGARAQGERQQRRRKTGRNIGS